MNYKQLGKSGLRVSPVCLGCMTFGEPKTGRQQWTLDEAASRDIIRQAVEAGINFFDTANAYSAGSSEEIVGRALRDFGRREELVIATKCFFRMGKHPNTGGLSRKAIMQAIDDSLQRLGTDYVDLYQIHRWDYRTPLEETLEALHDVVKAGKARYIGASSMFAWQFAKALFTAEHNGWTRFISMQNHLNLLDREEEREMLPLCSDQGVGVIPWSPLARGRLAREPEVKTNRVELDEVSDQLYGGFADSERGILDAVGAVAAQRGVPRAQVALSWVMGSEAVTAPIVGVSKSSQLDDALAAVELTLDGEERQTLEAAYVPRPVRGHR